MQSHVTSAYIQIGGVDAVTPSDLYLKLELTKTPFKSAKVVI